MIPQAVRDTVYLRALFACERCGERDSDFSVHHRRPRGMGGSRDPLTDSAANLLLLCGSGTTGCHGWVEANRAAARDLGLLVRQGEDPATVPVQLLRGLVLLTSDGYQEVAA